MHGSSLKYLHNSEAPKTTQKIWNDSNERLFMFTVKMNTC